jgi:hypothetical protein
MRKERRKNMQTTVLLNGGKYKVVTQQYESGLYVAIYVEGETLPIESGSNKKEVAYHRALRKKHSTNWIPNESSVIPNKPKIIKTIWDNGGKTMDRYTVILKRPMYHIGLLGSHESLGLSENPSDPQGFSQFGAAVEGEHLGKKIPFYDLSFRVINHIVTRLEEA